MGAGDISVGTAIGWNTQQLEKRVGKCIVQLWNSFQDTWKKGGQKSRLLHLGSRRAKRGLGTHIYILIGNPQMSAYRMSAGG